MTTRFSKRPPPTRSTTQRSSMNTTSASSVEKPIETHVSRVFGKLGVRSRAEVAARIAAGDRD